MASAHDLAGRLSAATATWLIGSRRCPALYIADGHHRAASAARAARAAAAERRGDAANATTFLAVAFPDNQTQILPYNRAVKDLGGLTPDGSSRRCGSGSR